MNPLKTLIRCNRRKARLPHGSRAFFDCEFNHASRKALGERFWRPVFDGLFRPPGPANETA